MKTLTRTFGSALLCVLFATPLLAQTTGAIAKFTSSSTVGDSSMFQNVSGMIGVNTTTPADFMSVRFTNTGGSATGFAVQNLGSTATSYSGMLFYDQNGALGQFQGFNNSTHEYRINNIASSGSINFMLGSTSKFLVSSGRVDVSTDLRLGTPNGIDFEPASTGFNGIKWVDGTGAIIAHMHRFGAVDNRLYVTNAGVNNLTGVYLASGATSWTSTSDARLKANVVPVTGILDKIKNISVVAFDMALQSVDNSTGKAVVNRNVPPRTTRDGTVIKQQIGSIAQDWVANFPELVVEPETADQYYGLNYERIGVVALGGVKELSNLLAEKEAEIQALNARLAALEKRLAEITEIAYKAGAKSDYAQ